MDEQNLSGKSLLIVDDEADLRSIIASELEFLGAKVAEASNISEALAYLKQNKIDLIVSDIRMPGGTGIDLLKSIKAQDVNIPAIILITGFADITLEEAYAYGAEALINKPFQLDELLEKVAYLTSPKEDKLSGAVANTKSISVNFNQTVAAAIEQGMFALGRGGFALKQDRGMRCSGDEILNFKLEFTDQLLEGSCICRWCKIGDHPQQIINGMELLQLTEKTRSWLEEYLKKNPLVPFIPSLH
jgi:CheY-like chemotaxis protein